MIGLIIYRDGDELRYAPDDITARGNFFEGRLSTPSASSATVNRWLPISVALSQSNFRIRDEDGEIAEIMREGTAAGREADVVWIGDDADVRLTSGVIRNLKAGRGFVRFQIQDPALLRFGSGLSPILVDIEPDVEEDIAGNLVPQVYGRATRLPVAGGLVRGGNIELVAALGEREVTAVRYDGTLLAESTWEAICNCSSDPAYTIIRVTGDNDRDVAKFEWSGGETEYTLGGMIHAVLLTNGVLETEINAASFDRFDRIMEARGLQAAGDTPEGAIVVKDRDETVNSVLERVQNSWGVATYLGSDRRIRIGIPVYDEDASVIDIPADEIMFGGWGLESPEAATEWAVESDREWSRNTFRVQRTLVLEANEETFGDVVLKGRTLKQWYSRGHSARNIAGDRILLERWDFFRAKLTVNPGLLVNTGDYVRITDQAATIQISDAIFFVDGVSITGSGMDTSRELSLSPILGVGTDALLTSDDDFTYTLDSGDELDENLDDLFSR